MSGHGGSHTQRSLVTLAERAGYVVDERRGKGSHVYVSRPGVHRPSMIPAKVFRNSVLGIISQLQEGADDANT